MNSCYSAACFLGGFSMCYLKWSQSWTGTFWNFEKVRQKSLEELSHGFPSTCKRWRSLQTQTPGSYDWGRVIVKCGSSRPHRKETAREGSVGQGWEKAPGELVPWEQTEEHREPNVWSEALTVILIAVISRGKKVILECNALFPNKVNLAESRNLFCLQFHFLAC